MIAGSNADFDTNLFFFFENLSGTPIISFIASDDYKVYSYDSLGA